MNKSLLIGIAVILLSSLAMGRSNRITGHIKPLPREQLAQPIQLSCGVTIEEWRGYSIDAAARSKVERLCNEAIEYFPEYIASKDLDLTVSEEELDSFSFPYSLLPDNTRYRSLNDTRYRFYDRPFRNPIWAYTSHTDEWVFMLGNWQNTEFSDTFVHETYHALTWRLGIFHRLPGRNYSERRALDEKMAQEFTRELGY